jgi:peptide/nickel transport system ATP-binding protein
LVKIATSGATHEATRSGFQGSARPVVGSIAPIMLALVLNAHLVVLDEPTTALDVITQANILDIVRDVHAERGLTTLVITHDIVVVAEVADQVAVMYGGRVVEQGPVRDVLGEPQHPFTRALIRAIPKLSGDIDEAKPLPRRPPSLMSIPKEGCVFRERCPMRMDLCETLDPALLAPAAQPAARLVACHAVNSPRLRAESVEAST